MLTDDDDGRRRLPSCKILRSVRLRGAKKYMHVNEDRAHNYTANENSFDFASNVNTEV